MTVVKDPVLTMINEARDHIDFRRAGVMVQQTIRSGEDPVRAHMLLDALAIRGYALQLRWLEEHPEVSPYTLTSVASTVLALVRQNPGE